MSHTKAGGMAPITALTVSTDTVQPVGPVCRAAVAALPATALAGLLARTLLRRDEAES
jgi:hypothetical protein